MSNKGAILLKRLISMILSVMLFCLSLQTTVFAASNGSPKLSVDSLNTNAGETVKVNIYLENNPGIISACINVAFDSGLTLINAKNGNTFPSSLMFITPKQLTNGGQITGDCNFVWQGADIQNKDIKDGVILTLMFSVSENAKRGDAFRISITSRKGDVIDKNLSNVNLGGATGKITVTAGASEPGGDGEHQNTFVSFFDWLRQLIAKIKEIFSKIVKA